MLNRVTMLAGAAALLVGIASPAAAAPVIEELPLLPGTQQATALDINDSGTIAGRSDGPVNPGYYVPVQWAPNGTISELGMLTNDISGQAYAINNSGVVAGESWNPLAVRWRP